MSKFMVGAISFLAGICVSGIFAGSASQVSPHPASQVVSDFHPDGTPRPVLQGLVLASAVGPGTGSAINMRGLEVPQLADINLGPIVKRIGISNIAQQLDGLDCRNCLLDNAVLRYGGGPFNLVGTRVSGKITIEYTGAAANTVAMIDLLKGLGVGASPKPAAPGKPIKRETPPPPGPKNTFDFTSPFVSGN